jgi:hypothetical protein
MSRSRPRVVSRCSFQTDSGVSYGNSVGRRGRSRALEPAAHVDGDGPVVRAPGPAAARRAHAADAALAVGDGAVLLAPGGGGQQQVGVGAVAVVAKASCSTTNSARCSARRTVAWSGSALRGVGAGDPQRLDLAIGRGLEHLHRGLARRAGTTRHAPQRATSARCCRVGQVAVRAQQVGQATDLAPAHRIGLAGQRERAGTRLADLAVARCRLISVLFLAVPLLLWFRPWQYSDSSGRGRRWPSSAVDIGEPARRLHDVGLRRPQTLAACAGVNSRTRSRSASKPLVWAAM